MSTEQLVRDLSEAFVEAKLMDATKARQVAHDPVEQEDEQTIQDFLGLIKETKSEVLKELAKQRELSEELHDVQETIKHLTVDVEHIRFLIEIAKKLQK
jgi:hypothetical protein